MDNTPGPLVTVKRCQRSAASLVRSEIYGEITGIGGPGGRDFPEE